MFLFLKLPIINNLDLWNPLSRGDRNTKQREAYVLGFRGVFNEVVK